MTEPTQGNKKTNPSPRADAANSLAVKVICGGRDEVWESRDMAYGHYRKLYVDERDPKMREAYKKICRQLEAGQTTCSEHPGSKRRKESIRDEINADKFNYMDFCREDYDAAKDSQSFDEVIGRISVGKILIKLRKVTLGQALAEFYAIDEMGGHGKTEGGMHFEYAQNIRITFDESIGYRDFRERLDKKLIQHIDNYEGRYFCLWDKLLHRQGERIGIEGEIRIGEYLAWASSGATVLEDELYDARELRCRIDDVEGHTVECMAPIRLFKSPFSGGYGKFIQKQEPGRFETDGMRGKETPPSHGRVGRKEPEEKWITGSGVGAYV